jgi:hypothetical protein
MIRHHSKAKAEGGRQQAEGGRMKDEVRAVEL